MSSVFLYILSKWPFMLAGVVIGTVWYHCEKHIKGKRAGQNESSED